MIWCAEIGSSHQGDLSLAYELIRKSAWAGADLVKFQLGWTEIAQLRYAKNYDQRRYIDHWAEQLNKWCEKFSVEFFASIWSFEGLEVARKVGMKRYKIAHQMREAALYAAIVREKMPTYVSTVGDEVVLDGAIEIDCSPDYPTYAFSYADRKFGYSSHMHGIGDALIAVARGAQYIEKHITLDKTMPFPRDNSFALLPEEFRTMVDVGGEIYRMLR